MFNVQFITHYTDTVGYAESARLALEGGCRWIQLRMKDTTDEEAEPVARQVQELCRACGAYFVLDDRVELAKRLGQTPACGRSSFRQIGHARGRGARLPGRRVHHWRHGQYLGGREAPAPRGG